MSDKPVVRRTNKSTFQDMSFKPFEGLDLLVELNFEIKHPKDLTKLPRGIYKKRVIVDLRDLVVLVNESPSETPTLDSGEPE